MKLETRLRETMRFKHYSLRTEEAYVGWYLRFVKFHELRHPKEMGAVEVEAFLTHLAVDRKVAEVAEGDAEGIGKRFFYCQVAKEDKFLITRTKGVFGFTAKARRSQRTRSFLDEAKRGVAEVAEEDAEGESGDDVCCRLGIDKDWLMNLGLWHQGREVFWMKRNAEMRRSRRK
jgi:hypothetical protein